MNRVLRCWPLAIGLLVTGVAGCGAKRPATVPVTGKVTYKGQPVEGAAVLFTRDNGPPATGETNAQGMFALKMTSGEAQGAVPGDYKVAITKIESAPPPVGDGRIPAPSSGARPKSLLPVKYSDPKATDLKATVAPGKANEFTFDLKD